jgi:osmotically-inducible protein OsmY
MARDDDWREERRWYDDREDAQRRADYSPTGGSRYGYEAQGDRTHPGYRAAREDAWLDARRRAERRDYPRSPDERAYQPFGATGPTAYGPYYDSPYAWGAALSPYGIGAPFAGMMGAYGAARSDYAPGRYETGRFGVPPQGARPDESRTFLDKAADQVASWFGDRGAEHRRHEDELQAGHRGRGPKSYKRSDARIQEDVNDRLTEDPWLDATDIEVSVSNGDITLTGMVLSREDKRRAEQVAERVSGVGDVQNNLRLRRYDGTEPGEKPSAGNF